MFRLCHLLTEQTRLWTLSKQNRWNSTGADPLFGPLVFTSFPSISKPSVGRLPSGRAGLSPTRWQSTDRDTLTWLTDRWTCQSQKEEDERNHKWTTLFCYIWTRFTLETSFFYDFFLKSFFKSNKSNQLNSIVTYSHTVTITVKCICYGHQWSR